MHLRHKNEIKFHLFLLQADKLLFQFLPENYFMLHMNSGA